MKDELSVGYSFQFKDTLESGRTQSFYILISKLFLKDSLKSATVDSEGTRVPTGDLMHDEFISVFPLEDIGYVRYNNDVEAISTTGYWGGAEISYDNGLLWKSEYVLGKDSATIEEFRSNSHFEIIDVYVYDNDKTIYVEVEFELEIYPYNYYETIMMKNGHFKGYLRR